MTESKKPGYSIACVVWGKKPLSYLATFRCVFLSSKGASDKKSLTGRGPAG